MNINALKLNVVFTTETLTKHTPIVTIIREIMINMNCSKIIMMIFI